MSTIQCNTMWNEHIRKSIELYVHCVLHFSLLLNCVCLWCLLFFSEFDINTLLSYACVYFISHIQKFNTHIHTKHQQQQYAKDIVHRIVDSTGIVN